MLCPACQTDVPAGSAFCSKCGAKLGPVAPSAAPTAADKMRATQTTSAAATEPEQELWHGGFSPKAMYGTWIVAVLVTAAGIVVSLLMPPAWTAAAAVVAAIWFVSFAYSGIARLSVCLSLTTE